MPKPISCSGGAALFVSLASATVASLALATACAKDNVPSSYVCLTAPKDRSLPVAAELPGPHYPESAPESARDNHIIGWVEVSLSIDRDGHVKDASVVASEPRGFFEEAALAAVKKWRYCPLPKDAPDYTAPINRRISFGE